MKSKFPLVIKQLVPSAEVRKFISDTQGSQRTVKSTGWGRATNDIPIIKDMSTQTIGGSFWDIMYSCAKEHFGETALPSYWKWSRYSPKYGAPNIPPHIDINACTYTIDLQLMGDVEWEIFVEGTPYTMQDGDALLYLGSEQMHWRPKYPNRNYKSFLEMCFIHFVEPGHWYHENGPKWIDSDDVRLPWREKMMHLLPKYKCDTYQPFEDPTEFPGY